MSDGRELCEAGCLAFYGGEVKHHKDCVHYPESQTKMLDDLQAQHRAELEAVREEYDRLRYVLGGVRGAIETGRNEPLMIWRDQIDIALDRDLDEILKEARK